MSTRQMKVLTFGDTHAPFHNKLVVKLLMSIIFKWKPDLVIHLGDLFDCNGVSKFPGHPDKKTRLIDEIKTGHHILGLIPEATKRVFCMGNHEDWIRKYIWRQAPEVWGFLATDDLLGLKEAGWHVVPVVESFKMGNLVATHSFGRHGKSAVKHAMTVHRGKTVIIGHTHRLESMRSSEDKKEHTHGLSAGWTGSVLPITYRHHDLARFEWQHGFVAGHMDDNGDAHMTAIPIRDNTWCYLDGQVYTVER